ncbi:MAG TPA: addiction module protein [Acidiferrobacterales bacterium]|jgi:putative addiction module component (TIGR02574 family)
MTDAAKKVFQEALDLPASERAALIDELILSLDKPDPRIDELWAREAEDRLRAYRAGEIDAIPAEQVFGELKKP